MSQFATVSAKLKTILEELEGVGKPLVEVYDWPNPSPDKWPSAFVRALGGSVEERMDSATNFLQMRFQIRIMLRAKNTQANEALRVSILDSVLSKLRSYADTLDGTVERFDIDTIEPVDYGNAEQPLIGFDIMVIASKLQSI